MALTSIQPDARFQDSVIESELMTPSNSAGTPAAGTFYTSILNRKSMVDLRKDLKPRMAIERIAIPQIYQIQDEVGPSNEVVWGVLNDTYGQLRLVGPGWQNINNNNGASPNTQGNGLGDYMEVTFYGTGLNLLVVGLDASRDIRVSIDGGSESANLISNSSTQSTVLQTRNYSPNVVLPISTGLSLGVHTAKIRVAAAVSTSFPGVEILNESSSVNVNPGYAQIGNRKTYLSSQALGAYNSSFESGVLGTRGGRVLMYMKKDGTIAKAVQPVDASSATLSSAAHGNEEVARVYHWREFGAGRTDDFSGALTATARAFTLDDGTTTLTSNQANSESVSNTEVIYAGNTFFLTVTFIGTGLDVIVGSSGARNTNISIDGGSALNIVTSGATALYTQKIVSGLPYGTHTVKFSGNGAACLSIAKFIVYQPKKPTLPSGAIELADYNILADYVGNSTAGIDFVATGVVKKANIREMQFVGSWSIGAPGSAVGNSSSGVQTFSITNNDYFEYTFFGTGLEFRYNVGAGGTDTATISIDGLTFNTTNYPSQAAAATTYGASSSFASGTGILTAPASAIGHGLKITGLSLGRHTIRVTKSSGSGNWFLDSFDIITPIHSQKSSLYADLQNTLPIGSQGISDNRKTSALKEAQASQKAWAQAIGVTANPTTTSSAMVPVPDMSLTIKTNGGPLEISAFGTFFTNSANTNVQVQIYVNGVAASKTSQGQTVTASNTVFTLSPSLIVPVPAGTHKVDLYWLATGGSTATSQSDYRTIKAREL